MATYNLTSSIPAASSIKTGDILNCPYSGTYKTLTLPKGTYKLECWGGEGGGQRISGNTASGFGGLGGYSYGTLVVPSNTIFYLYAGGYGLSSISGVASGGFNGGGSGYASSSSEPGNGGGGASDIRIASNSLYSRVIVAGGGGGGGEDNGDAYGAGGGVTGVNIVGSTYNGTQTSAGSNGSFGIGATTNFGDGGGGGGGWYGGGTVQSTSVGTDTQGGGGGSGYVYTSSTYSNYPSGCLLNSTYYLTSAATVAGNTSFVDYSGSTVTGHQSNGAIRITALEVPVSINLKIKINNTIKDASSVYVNINGVWKQASQIKTNINGTWK